MHARVGRRGGRTTTSSSPAFFAVASMVPSMSSSSGSPLAREGPQLAQRHLDLPQSSTTSLR
jgi:hypothetical protein